MSTGIAPNGMEDRVLAHGEVAGVKWATVRAPLCGAVNGYVLVPEGHPWNGKAYHEIHVEVHGGLTYGHGDGWIGFDTLHSGDIWPGTPDLDRGFRTAWDREWTEEMAAEETKRLAANVALAADGGTQAVAR